MPRPKDFHRPSINSLIASWSLYLVFLRALNGKTFVRVFELLFKAEGRRVLVFHTISRHNECHAKDGSRNGPLYFIVRSRPKTVNQLPWIVDISWSGTHCA